MDTGTVVAIVVAVMGALSTVASIIWMASKSTAALESNTEAMREMKNELKATIGSVNDHERRISVIEAIQRLDRDGDECDEPGCKKR